MSELRVRRPAECVADCSDGDHEFAPGGEGEVITGVRPYETSDGLTGVEWDLYGCVGHEDDPADPGAEVVSASYRRTEFEGDVEPAEGEADDSTFLCRCCQHVLEEVPEPPTAPTVEAARSA
jgi:hypothetical protein